MWYRVEGHLRIKGKEQPNHLCCPSLSLEEALDVVREELHKEKLGYLFPRCKEGIEKMHLDGGIEVGYRVLSELYEGPPRTKTLILDIILIR